MEDQLLQQCFNLVLVDSDQKFDAVFDKYYSFLSDKYLVTVANVVGNSTKKALAKPYLIQKITDELLKVENISITPRLTEECKRLLVDTDDRILDVELNSYIRVLTDNRK